MECTEDRTEVVRPAASTVFPDLSLEGPSASHVRASHSRCESVYELDPHARLICNRYSQSEVGIRLEKVEEPLTRVQPLIDQIRTVVKNADYCMLIADDECAAVAEFHDTEMARYLKKQGIAVGTLWDEASVGTNGIGTSTADTTAVTVNGSQHFHSKLHQFICSAAPLVDQCGRRYGALNLTGPATTSATEVIRLSQFVRRSAENIHSYLFRDFFKNHTLVAIADERFNDPGTMSHFFAVDEGGCIVGATNALVASLNLPDRELLMGVPLDKIIGIDLDTLLSSEDRLHRLESEALDGGYAIRIPPSAKRRQFHAASTPSTAAVQAQDNQHPGLDRLAGDDSCMRKHVDLCRRMICRHTSPSAVPLLLQGETGTGKDTFARAVHRESHRRDKPFVELNCAAIPESLIDSELFGYAPGTFTGGLKEGKTGHVETANGGTLFLDEIGDMPMDSQTRLLRVLSDRKIQPLGASKAVDVEFALVCASHRDLIGLVQEGKFREDLYYRVCGAKVTLPALRDRSDFHTIAANFLQEIDPEAHVKLSDAVWHKLKDYAWPGNIRQLQTALQYIVFSCGEGVAEEHNLPEDILHDHCLHAPRHATVHLDDKPRSRKEELLDALQQSRWCVTKAAKIAGVSRATVHRQMKKYGIVRPDHQCV